MVYLTGTDVLQVYSDSAWVDVWKPGNLATRRADTLGDPSNVPGEIVVRTLPGETDQVYFSTGTQWTRLLDTTDASTAQGAISTDFVNTTSQGGTTNPAGGSGINANVLVPDSSRLQIIVSAKLRAEGGSTVHAIFGYMVESDTGSTLISFNDQRAVTTHLNEYQGMSWGSIVNVGANQVGKTVTVRGVHATQDNAWQAQFSQRELVVVPVR
jgi:hypothetical protein